MRETPNLLLKLPEDNDFVQVEDLNENFTKIDEEIAKITDEETGVEAQLAKHLGESGRKEYVLFDGALTSGNATLTLPQGIALLDFSEIMVKIGSVYDYGSTLFISKVGEFITHSYSVIDGGVPTLYWISFVVTSAGLEIRFNREGKADGTAFTEISEATWVRGVWGVKYV